MHTYGLVNRGNDPSQFCLCRGGLDGLLPLDSLKGFAHTSLDTMILVSKTFPLAIRLDFVSFLISRCDGVWKWRGKSHTYTTTVILKSFLEMSY